MRLRGLLCILALAGISLPAESASIDKKYSYFNLYGKTAEDLDREIAKRGPKLLQTGTRHPGATTMNFGLKTKITNDGTYCKLDRAYVTLDLKLSLPRWKGRERATQDMGIMWDTLSSDIKRHEERHALIARSYAIDLERSLENLPRNRDCKRLQANAESVAKDLLKRHADAQAQFDKIESINFEARISRLLEYRLQRIEEYQARVRSKTLVSSLTAFGYSGPAKQRQ
jgi:predicted secreted Zn-dependent protease